MDYIITKQTLKNQWRIYLDEANENETVVYKGHKLGVEPKHLMEFLDYRLEKSTGKLFFLNYQKIKESVNTKDLDIWILGNSANMDQIMDQSWNTLQNKLKEKDKNFRKIVVTRVNI